MVALLSTIWTVILTVLCVILVSAWQREKRRADRYQAMLEDGESVRRAAAERLADAPVVARLHLSQDR